MFKSIPQPKLQLYWGRSPGNGSHASAQAPDPMFLPVHVFFDLLDGFLEIWLVTNNNTSQRNPDSWLFWNSDLATVEAHISTAVLKQSTMGSCLHCRPLWTGLLHLFMLPVWPKGLGSQRSFLPRVVQRNYMEHTGAKEGRSLVFLSLCFARSFGKFPPISFKDLFRVLHRASGFHSLSTLLLLTISRLQLNSHARTEIFKFSLKFGLHQLQHRPFLDTFKCPF